MSRRIKNAQLNELVNSSYFINKIEESMMKNPEAFTLPDELNELIFSRVIKKLITRDSKIQESIKSDNLDVICKKALKVCNIGPSSMSKILGIPMEHLKKFIDGTVSVINLGPTHTANILDFFSIPFKNLNIKLKSIAEAIELSSLPYASHSRLVGRHSANRNRKIPPRANKNDIDNFIEMIKKKLESKDRYDLL